MTFTEDNSINSIETQNPDWERIEYSLKLIDPLRKAFYVLTNDTGSYIQCAGSKERLTIEIREYENKKDFKHFVIGKDEDISPLKTVWTQIECRVGPIRIHDSEVLNINDAIVVFQAFFKKEKLPMIYKKRNVTRQHNE